MPLDDLISVTETLKERLRTHQSVLQGNETRTRMALIDPLLSALGWDTADPCEGRLRRGPRRRYVLTRTART